MSDLTEVGLTREVVLEGQCKDSYCRGRVEDTSPLCYPVPLRNRHPTGSAKGCRGAASDIVVFALAVPRHPLADPVGWRFLRGTEITKWTSA